MELQELEKPQEPQTNNKDNVQFLHVIVNLNPCLAEDETLLLSYYNKVKTTWSSSAIKSLQKATELKLTSKVNRCRFAVAAAKFQLKELQVTTEVIDVDIESTKNNESVSSIPTINNANSEVVKQLERQLKIQSSSIELLESNLSSKDLQLETKESELEAKEAELEEQKRQFNQRENFFVLLLAHRILAPGLPLNGTEESPAMRILGSPKTKTELYANYRELIKREYPDVSLHEFETARKRFQFVRALFRITRDHWEDLKPTAVITREDYETRMNAKQPFEPSSFWKR